MHQQCSMVPFSPHPRQHLFNILYKMQVSFPRYLSISCLSPFPRPTSVTLPVLIVTLFLLSLSLSSCQLESSDHVSRSGITCKFTHPVEFPWRVPLGLRHRRGLFSHQCRVLGIAALHNSLDMEQTTPLVKASYLSLHVIKKENERGDL